MDQVIDKVNHFVFEYMSRFDASHDYHHIERVVSLARTIEASERRLNPNIRFRSDVVILASLLHDVGDRKYLGQGEDGTTMVQMLLLGYGVDEKLAQEVQQIVNHVSFSSEVNDPAKVQRFLVDHPELAIVQDADRLDAIGAVGIGRCFAYNATSLDYARVHITESLENREKMMKTQLGKEMAKVRTERLKTFRSWWDEEVSITDQFSLT